ncbi:hypothetical protein C8J57DRAFT_1566000 [Mycena rebaudengoi]|nr:hypothetical protein C8J57DRAFT_1566000 [Mycena rebaudengoi]
MKGLIYLHVLTAIPALWMVSIGRWYYGLQMASLMFEYSLWDRNWFATSHCGPNVPRLDSAAVAGKGTELTPKVQPGLFFWVYGNDATSPPDEGENVSDGATTFGKPNDNELQSRGVYYVGYPDEPGNSAVEKLVAWMA